MKSESTVQYVEILIIYNLIKVGIFINKPRPDHVIFVKASVIIPPIHLK